MVSTEPIASETVEATCVRLRQLAGIAADFYRALVDQGYPADKAGDLCSLWFDYELGWSDE